jgi:hypothetical protein
MSSAHIEERGNSPEAIQQEFPLPGGEVAHLPFAQICYCLRSRLCR